MFVNFRRIRKCQLVQLMTTCLLLSVAMVCWEQLDSAVISHVKSYSFRYLINRFTYINQSLTIPREQARSFSDFPYLLDHPHKCSGKDVLLLIFVKSSPENTERRNAIRSTWGNETYIQNTLGVTIKVVFALGAVQPKRGEPSWSSRRAAGLQEQLIQENDLHGDLVQKDFLDSFHNLTLKLIMQFHWMHSRCSHARFLMTADDDVFVHTPNLVSYLQDTSRRGVTDLWIGRVHTGAPPVRSKKSKYYVPHEMYQLLSYPDYTAGAGYVVSSDLADKIYHAMLTLNASLYIDDVFMGICANAVSVSPQEHVYFSGEGKAIYHPCIYSQMMTSHGHVDDIYDLWTAATHPQVKQRTSGLFGKLYCTAVKMALLCKPHFFDTYPCKAAFL
ncbi:lactosylceramide 1,3-N-acetyl-beta-D-glucosaminyltransferase B [Kryptolebias marmoratus]|uniref:Hexosyltransferase n=1 Tax=Kryptolebias marmoratus TaxID=37003 RepID=A0A3Q2ZNQ9_KRYMA|nr:lactosylceramide 1,3-N-acetyl-beta-D-glucosaminyltransferase B [Kryptolebias marmoratus]XP_017275670.1 lactosylceramide 1,3-N-acetyl-beta-D-glucosaminyltransferase B [Kryptolebias marmoratus]XP_024862575.1 lactosylceramide 1,3-N-acetyl-beta-D-glucosaminyltransferase B [Kryptolebias marmoratus]XP_024862576.1 lactosylceramide 1,3-N-acetyl-beta-D-glucosaminyltransferase B [Kryptolebias marmoratus]XP_037828938.1 lactosylceramide 1,3-N-acetyl-beta-D-glucosaminyltransferase B [Kryptolebias marmora